MSSSPYQILENRPLDQWRVTELREELKKRKLPLKGLKEDLVKRLDEAVRIERESAQSESDESQESESPPLAPEEDVQSSFPQAVLSENLNADGENTDDYARLVDQENIQENVYETTVETVVVTETTVETSVVVTENVGSVAQVGGQDLTNSMALEESGNDKVELVSEHIDSDSNTQLETFKKSELMIADEVKPDDSALENQAYELVSEYSESWAKKENDNSKTQLQKNKNSDLNAEEDAIVDSAAEENQVYEVSPNLVGSPVKCDSISTDSVSINEKIEIKDNIIADNVKLELDNVKPSTIVPVGGESYPRPMDVEEPHESKTCVEDKDDDIVNDTDTDITKKFDCLDDVGDSEKLNLDRSSGDESMEEDLLDSKQVDSKYRSNDDMGDGVGKIEVSAIIKDSRVGIVGDDSSTDKNGMAEKRKLNDQSLVGNNEHVKRQRRWNSESLQVPEPQNSNITLNVTPKDNFQSPASKGLSKVEPIVTDDAPKERVVPPSPKPPTSSLKVDRFLRPFTLKAVQELLGKTGNVVSFWMDHIKTHCFVTYSSVEEAVETRNALYNLQWPPNGGRQLSVEFVDPQEVKTRLEAPIPNPTPALVPNSAPVVPPGGGSQPSPRQPAPANLLPPPPLLNPSQPRERLLPQPPPTEEEKLLDDPPIVTLDDLFRKTKASPRIYYLPLSEEQVAGKLVSRGK